MSCSTVCQAVASCMSIPSSTSRSPSIFSSNAQKFDGALLFRSSVSYNRVNSFSPCRCAAATSVPAGEDVFSVVTSSTTSEVDYLGESTKGDLNLNFGILHFQFLVHMLPCGLGGIGDISYFALGVEYKQ